MALLPPRPAAVTRLIACLESIAPLHLAGGWDNVGLLVDAPRLSSDDGAPVVLLTNDLTDKVVAEAAELGAQLVVSYHPTPFGGLKKLVREDRAARVVVACLARGISVFSPHTAMDCTVGGVNDWLASVVMDTEFDIAKVAAAVDTPAMTEAVRPITPAKPPGHPSAGEGRFITLPEPVPLAELLRRVKSRLALSHVQVAIADTALPADRVTSAAVVEAAQHTMVSTVAVCAGSGRSVLAGTTADVWLTGEMSHHDCLAAAASGTTVIVTNHTNTERGFLPHLAERLSAEAGMEVTVKVSGVDADPLVTV